MKYLVYKCPRAGYMIEAIHDGESYGIFPQQFDAAWDAIGGRQMTGPSVDDRIIVWGADGSQVNLLTGDFAGEFPDAAEARKHQGRLIRIAALMEE